MQLRRKKTTKKITKFDIMRSLAVIRKIRIKTKYKTMNTHTVLVVTAFVLAVISIIRPALLAVAVILVCVDLLIR